MMRLLAAFCLVFLAASVAQAQVGGAGIATRNPAFIGIDITAPPYNAKCNVKGVDDGSSADDTVAIQKAITDAQAVSGAGLKGVVFPPSKCRITSALTVATRGLALVGTPWLSEIYLDSATASTDHLHMGFQTSQLSNFFISGLAFSRKQAGSTGWAINMKNVGNVNIRDVYVFGGSLVGNGVKAIQYSVVELHNVYVQSVTGTCFEAGGTSSTTTGDSGYINTLGSVTGGSAYTAGTYTNVALTGGTGTNATAATIVVGGGGAVTSVTMQGGFNPLTNTGYIGSNTYKVGDTVSALAANIGGTGSGFSVPVTAVGMNAADFRLTDWSKCTGGQHGLVIDDWAGGVYVTSSVFFAGGVAISQSSTDVSHVLDSYQFVANDFDSNTSAMVWTMLWDGHITGNRFGYNTTNIVTINRGFDVVITGNNFVGDSATNCISLGDNGGQPNIVQNATISGNNIYGCHYAVNITSTAKNISVVGNNFSGQTSYNVQAGSCSYSRVTIGPNNYDYSLGTAPIQYGCPVDSVLSTGPHILGQFRAADFNSILDQRIPISGNVVAYQLTSIVVTNCSANMTTAAGGFYPTTGKGGTAIVAEGQAYSALTTSGGVLNATIAANPAATRYTTAGTPNVYLSLTTAQGSAATCDVYLMGLDLT